METKHRRGGKEIPFPNSKPTFQAFVFETFTYKKIGSFNEVHPRKTPNNFFFLEVGTNT